MTRHCAFGALSVVRIVPIMFPSTDSSILPPVPGWWIYFTRVRLAVGQVPP